MRECPHDWHRCLIKKNPESSLTPLPCKDTEKSAWRGLLLCHAGVLILDFQPPELWRNKCLLFINALACGILLTAAQVDKDALEYMGSTNPQTYPLSGDFVIFLDNVLQVIYTYLCNRNPAQFYFSNSECLDNLHVWRKIVPLGHIINLCHLLVHMPDSYSGHRFYWNIISLQYLYWSSKSLYIQLLSALKIFKQW